MINLLPKEEQEGIRNEYRMRIATVATSVVFYLCIIAIVLLIPTYYSIRLDSERLSGELSSWEAKSKVGDSSMAEMVKKIQSEVQIAGQKPATIFGNDTVGLVRNITESRGNGITLSSIGYIVDKGSKETLLLSGKAGTRDALIAYREKLAADPRFGSVDLPSALLVKRSDIAFTITLVVATPKTK